MSKSTSYILNLNQFDIKTTIRIIFVDYEGKLSVIYVYFLKMIMNNLELVFFHLNKNKQLAIFI